MIAAGKKEDKIVSKLFLHCYSQQPAKAKLKSIAAAVAADPASRQVVFEDVFWALMNSKEFYFNHW
jgi:hypothetical protein